MPSAVWMAANGTRFSSRYCTVAAVAVDHWPWNVEASMVPSSSVESVTTIWSMCILELFAMGSTPNFYERLSYPNILSYLELKWSRGYHTGSTMSCQCAGYLWSRHVQVDFNYLCSPSQTIQATLQVMTVTMSMVAPKQEFSQVIWVDFEKERMAGVVDIADMLVWPSFAIISLPSLILVGLISGTVFDVATLELYFDILRYTTCYAYRVHPTHIFSYMERENKLEICERKRGENEGVF